MEYEQKFLHKTIFTSFTFYSSVFHKSCILCYLSALHFICKHFTDEIMHIKMMRVYFEFSGSKYNGKKKHVFQKLS